MYNALITTPLVVYTGDPEGNECVPFWYSYVVYPYFSINYVALLGYN